jgi:glycerol uptake facilitator-like aquaporin
MKNKIIAEYFGTALLLVVVTGSGIMGEALSAGNSAVALLGNSIATGCGLYVLISLLGPVSGANFNPVVSMMSWRMKALNANELMAYVMAQFVGAISGVWLTHLMFALPMIQNSAKPRHGVGIWVSEFISTLVLLGVIRLGTRYGNEKVPMLVALAVTAGYWFTSSTFFANPAVTLARCLTNTFVGIAPSDVVGFIAAQLFALIIFCLFLTNPKGSNG